MNNINLPLIQSVAVNVLKQIPHRPFFCLPLSALFYAELKDNHGIDAKLVAGSLTYKGQFIFKHDFELSNGDHTKFKLWGGHAWVEVENMLWDLSFFRSLYSPKFNKPYKTELLQFFGIGRGLMAIEGREIAEIKLDYHPIEFLSDDFATGIIKGIDTMLQTEW
jgi:hypothetical protein